MEGERRAEVLGLFNEQLGRSRAAGHRYLLGAHVTALDIYLATSLTYALPLPEGDCPQMLPLVRPAFAYLVEKIGADIPSSVVEHRAYMFRTHLPWPIVLRAAT